MHRMYMHLPPPGGVPVHADPHPPINMASEIFENLKVFCKIRCPHFTKSWYRGIVKKESSLCVRYGALSFLKAKRLQHGTCGGIYPDCALMIQDRLAYILFCSRVYAA